MNLSQIETYKNQISNLKQQITLFEERFEQLESDRIQSEHRAQKAAKQTVQQVVEKMSELEKEKDALILRLQDDVGHLSAII